jgi:hypothetical protein
MRRTFYGMIFIFFLLFLCNPHLVSGAQQPEISATTIEGPKAHFSETMWDFGKIPANSVVSHAYWIKNVGTDTLKILKVRPG